MKRKGSACRVLEQNVLIDEIAGKQGQTCPADRPGLAADRAFDDLRQRDALKIVVFEGKPGGGDDPRSDPFGKTAIDDDAGKIDDGCGGDDGLRQRGRGLVDPAFQRFAKIDPFIG